MYDHIINLVIVLFVRHGLLTSEEGQKLAKGVAETTLSADYKDMQRTIDELYKRLDIKGKKEKV